MKRRIMYVMITILAVFTAGTLAAQTSPGPSGDRGFGPNRMTRSRRFREKKRKPPP